MDQINVQRWASSLRQFHRNHFQPSIVTDVCVGSQNSIRHASTTMKIRENESYNDNHRYAFTLDLTSPKKDANRILKSPFYTFNMTTKDGEFTFCPPHIQLFDNHTSNELNPPSDHQDADALSDAGTYIIEDDVDIAQDDEIEQENNSSSSLKRYADPENNRRGTFDIHGLISSTSNTIHRPIVDSNNSTNDLPSSSSLSNSSSSSSRLSFSNENNHNISKNSEDTSQNKSSNGHLYASNTVEEQKLITPPKNNRKPAECFVISPTSETKPFPTTNASQRRLEALFKSKSASITDSHHETSTIQSISSPRITHSIEKSPIQKQSSSIKQSNQPHLSINDQIDSSSSFQRNSTTRQTLPKQSQQQRETPMTINNDDDDNDNMSPNITKLHMNKSFILRRQHANLVPPPSPSKPIQQQQQTIPSKTLLRQPAKATLSTPTSNTNSSGQTNRAVELRRARAQAKIEELSQRSSNKQLPKTNQQNDIMSTSWHSSANTTNKKDLTNSRSNPRTTGAIDTASRRQNLLTTRTLPSSLHHRSSSVSPNPPDETSKYRRILKSTATDEPNQRMNTSIYSTEEEQCDSLRDNGQRLTIKLIQLSSGILEKLKPNDGVIYDNLTVNELEKIIEKLQMINRTLNSIDGSLTGLINDDPFV